MNSICKKFKKVISSVVLSCSMVCSCGFANAGLLGNKNVSEERLNKIERLGEKWCDELMYCGLNHHLGELSLTEKGFHCTADVLRSAVGAILRSDRLEAIGLVDKLLCGDFFLDNLIKAGLEKAILPPLNKMGDSIEASLEESSKLYRFYNFFLACWMMKYLESNDIRCALVCRDSRVFESTPPAKGISSLSTATDGFDGINFGVIFLSESNGELIPKIYVPYISVRSEEYGKWDRDTIFFTDCGGGVNSGPGTKKTYVFVGQNDLKMLGLKGRNKRDFDLVTPESWVNVVDKIVKKDNNPGQSLKPIGDKLFDYLIPPSYLKKK